jgi:hypothetical protein
MSNLDLLTQSQLRLFLSVDISGSTVLKNRKNHTGLLEEYENRKTALRTFAEKGFIGKPSIDLDDSAECVQGILHDYASEDSDWAAILARRFQDFHDAFATELVNAKYENSARELDYFLWKALGDELIYSFEISSRTQLHELVVCFLKVIRSFDLEDVSKKLIRLKGSGWVAGFPVRNRVVRFPGPQLYRRTDEGNCSEEHPYPRTDYLGPDMDTGFRIGDCGHPGFMVISMELAELLGETPDQLKKVRGDVVGWKRLKGVWDGIPYPVIWITLPEDLEIDYQPFDPWSSSDSEFVDVWLNRTEEKKLRDIGAASSIFDDCRRKLPETLGVVKPYIVDELTDKAPVPESHQRILHLLNSLNVGISGPQGEETESLSEAGRTKQEVERDMQESLEER